MKVPANTTLARVLADVDEAAGAGKARAEAADVDVALRVDLRHAEAGQVEAAAVVEVELLVLVDHRLGVDRGAEVQPALRHAADRRRARRSASGARATRSSLATAATPSGTPMPRLTTPPIGSSNAQRRAISLRSSSGIGASGRAAPGTRRRTRRCRRWRRSAGGARAGATTTQSTSTPGTTTCARIERAVRADALDLRDHEAVGVARGHRERQGVERERLALHRDVAGRVGGRAADQRDVDREAPCRTATPRRRSPSARTRSSVVRCVDACRPAWRGSTKVPRPTLVSVPARCAGDVAVQLGERAQRQVVGLDLVRRPRAAASFGTSAQWPPIARCTSPSCARRLRPRSLPSPGAAANTSVRSRGAPRVDEALLERGDQFLGRADADEARAARPCRRRGSARPPRRP